MDPLKFSEVYFDDNRIVYSATSNTNWYCCSCDVFHNNDVRRYSIITKHESTGYNMSFCGKDIHIRVYDGCVTCGNTTDARYTLSVELMQQNVKLQVLHCSLQCRKITRKKYRRQSNSVMLCDTCGKEFKKLKSCGRCKLVYYCSVSCQRADWPDHKTQCSLLSTS